MLYKIKNRVEKELVKFAHGTERFYSLKKISPLLSKEIKDFVLRKGKRLRPILFVIGYLGFAKRPCPNLYRSALSFELLHDFFIIHDDIIDKSDMRRGKPSMHKRLNNYLAKYKNIKFNGQDLSLVIGDIMYAMATDVFLSIKVNEGRKEKALKKFLSCAAYTACGEFIELLHGIKDIEDITKEDIYKIYDLKTAHYSFASPLSIGATLAGASQDQVNILFRYGIYLGRAFQIKDDILGIFGEEKKIGKSSLTDLREAKKTILIWHAYNNSAKKDKLFIRKLLRKDDVNKSDLSKMRKIVVSSRALDYAKKEISTLLGKTKILEKSSRMSAKYKGLLSIYSKELLKVPTTLGR